MAPDANWEPMKPEEEEEEEKPEKDEVEERLPAAEGTKGDEKWRICRSYFAIGPVEKVRRLLRSSSFETAAMEVIEAGSKSHLKLSLSSRFNSSDRTGSALKRTMLSHTTILSKVVAVAAAARRTKNDATSCDSKSRTGWQTSHETPSTKRSTTNTMTVSKRTQRTKTKRETRGLRVALVGREGRKEGRKERKEREPFTETSRRVVPMDDRTTIDCVSRTSFQTRRREDLWRDATRQSTVARDGPAIRFSTRKGNDRDRGKGQRSESFDGDVLWSSTRPAR